MNRTRQLRGETWKLWNDVRTPLHADVYRVTSARIAGYAASHLAVQPPIWRAVSSVLERPTVFVTPEPQPPENL